MDMMNNLHPSTPSPSEANSTENAEYMDTDGNIRRSTLPSSESHVRDYSVERVRETSMTGNVDHDIIIRDSRLRWYPFEEFKDVKFVARGGFSSIYYATIEGYSGDTYEFALKCIEGSNELSKEFMAEATLHEKLRWGDGYTDVIVTLYGITRQPETGNYMIVMAWCNDGDMRKYLSQYKTYYYVYFNIAQISKGLAHVHRAGFCHKDLHLGNILIWNEVAYIGDLGLCGSINKEANNSDQVVGVLPYIAPEVLNGQPYTQAADIYSLGMIIWSIFVHQQPFCDQDFTDTQLYWDIYQGKRPDIPNWIPHWLAELI